MTTLRLPAPMGRAIAGAPGRRPLAIGATGRVYLAVTLLLATLLAQTAAHLLLTAGIEYDVRTRLQYGLAAGTRAEQVRAELADHRDRLAAAGDRAPAAAEHRAGIAGLLAALAAERSVAPAEEAPVLARIGEEAARVEAAGIRATSGSEADLAAGRAAWLAALDRLEQAVEAWVHLRHGRSAATMGDIDALIRAAGAWSTGVAVAAGALGLVALLMLRAALRRLGGITAALLRLARHETGVAIPALEERGPVGELARAVAAFRDDRGELARREQARRQAIERLDTALNNMTQGLAMIGPDRRLQVVNRRFGEILGLPAGALAAGMTVREILALSIAAGNHGGRSQAEVEALVEARFATAAAKRFVATLGRGTEVEVTWAPMSDGGWLVTYDDVTALRRHEARLVHLARHDALTDLPNRSVVREAVGRALGQAERAGEGRAAPLAVLSINLDRFKPVIDSLGHEAGDAVLRQAADRLRGHVRAGDTPGRLAADAFVVVQAGVEQPTHAAALAGRLIEALSQPYAVGTSGTGAGGTGEGVAVVGASIGIALAGPGDRDPDMLLRNAELAQQRAKQEGGGVARFFAPEMDARVQERRSLELDLRQALARGEFELFYQPLISVAARRICAFEALLRWRHPTRGLVPPDLFIPLAEETGLIVPIGAWVLREACAEAATWPAEVSVAVNLSTVQFRRDGLVGQVQEALAATGLPATRLELEITESVLLHDSAGVLAILHALRGLGVRISMDDFGTGYSSLSYLRSFPFDKIKIDKSFIRGLDGSEESAAIVRAIAGLGHSLGIATTAEGVETLRQMAALVADGCTEMQGYLFSPPRPACEIGPLLAAGGTWPEAAAAVRAQA